MKKRYLIIALVTFFSILVIIFVFIAFHWVKLNSVPGIGATGAEKPVNILRVEPADGQSLSDADSFCVYFDFTAGLGMGNTPETSIHFFLDGTNVTSKVDGLIAPSYPPSLGLLCYKPGSHLNLGWHTALVTYQDNSKKSYSYKWRFQIIDN